MFFQSFRSRLFTFKPRDKSGPWFIRLDAFIEMPQVTRERRHECQHIALQNVAAPDLDVSISSDEEDNVISDEPYEITSVGLRVDDGSVLPVSREVCADRVDKSENADFSCSRRVRPSSRRSSTARTGRRAERSGRAEGRPLLRG